MTWFLRVDFMLVLFNSADESWRSMHVFPNFSFNFPGYSSTSVAKVQANSKIPASPVRSYRGADAISLQNHVCGGTFS